MIDSRERRDDLVIEYRLISALTENPDNAKNHPKKQISKIARSIKQFGFLVPILIDENSMVLCGHGRLAAAKELKLESAPTVCISHLSEAQRRAFVIADNKLAEQGSWNEAQLAEEFQSILKLEDHIEIIDTGFAIGEVDYLIEKSLADEYREETRDFLPEQAEKVCQPGDLWLLGEHRLFCGDALDERSYKILLNDEKAEMVFTDPPYNLPIAGVVSGLGKVKHSDFVQASGEMSRKEFGDFLEAFMVRMRNWSINGAIHYICIDWRQIDLLISLGRRIYDDLKTVCVWDKGSGGMGSLYRNRHELVAVFKSGTASHINNVKLGAHGRNRSNVWCYPGMSTFGRARSEKLGLHPTVKNLEMVADAILDCSNPGSLVLDPFAGSGTTALAAHRSRRRSALIELDPHYCDVILRRFCDATGIEPVNAWTGEVITRIRTEVRGNRDD